MSGAEPFVLPIIATAAASIIGGGVLVNNALNEHYIEPCPNVPWYDIWNSYIDVSEELTTKIDNLLNPYEKKFDYSQIIKISESNGFKIYKSKNGMCADFKGICINKPKKNYSLEYKNNYIFIKTTDRETL